MDGLELIAVVELGACGLVVVLVMVAMSWSNRAQARFWRDLNASRS